MKGLLRNFITKTATLFCIFFTRIKIITLGKTSIDNMLPHGQDFIKEYERFNMACDNYQPHTISNRLITLLHNCFFIVLIYKYI